MKEGWEYSTIGDLCDKMNGLWKGKIGPFVNVGVIRNANFTKSFTLSFDNIEYLDVEAKQYKTRKLQKGDLIVEKSGGSEKQPVGRTVLFDREDGDYSFSNFTSVLRIKDRDVISPEFLYKYILFVYLRGDTRKMQKATTGIHNIEFDKFLSIPVPKISLSEQQSIVDYLDSAFAKIDAMKANAEKALNEAKALFQATLKEMLEPKEGWEEKTLEEIAQIKIGPFGSLLHKSDYILGGVPLVNPIHMVNGHIAIDNNYTISESKAKELSSYRLKENDIVFARRGEIGRCALVGKNEDTYLCGTGSLLVRFNQEVDYGFMLLLFQSKYCKEYLEKQATGATMLNINSAIVGNMTIKYPHIDIQQSIVATLDSLKSKVDRLQENYDKISQECDALKQALLREVFEG